MGDPHVHEIFYKFATIKNVDYKNALHLVFETDAADPRLNDDMWR